MLSVTISSLRVQKIACTARVCVSLKSSHRPPGARLGPGVAPYTQHMTPRRTVTHVSVLRRLALRGVAPPPPPPPPLRRSGRFLCLSPWAAVKGAACDAGCSAGHGVDDRGDSGSSRPSSSSRPSRCAARTRHVAAAASKRSVDAGGTGCEDVAGAEAPSSSVASGSSSLAAKAKSAPGGGQSLGRSAI